jgi:DNA-binding FadR family transcriptional regulator
MPLRFANPRARRGLGGGIRLRKRAASAHDQVMRGLGLAIVSGQYPAGSLLPNKDLLTKQFKVSNSTLREAMQKLVAKGMIVAKTKVGTRVLEPRHWNMFDADILDWRFEIGVDRPFLAQLFELRQTFEPMAAALMATRRTPEQLAQLTQLARRMREADGERQSFAEADLAFHLLVLQSSDNPFLQSIGALIRTALAASFTMSAPGDDRHRVTVSEASHDAIVEAIAARDPDAAARAMMAVILDGWASIGGVSETVLTHMTLREFRPGL